MSITVRPAHPPELAAAGDLVVAAYLADGGISADDEYLEDLRDAPGRARDSVVLVAVQDDRLVGTVTWCPHGSSHRELAGDDEGEFRSLGVAPGARGRGVGELLVRACLDRAGAEGYAAVVLCSATWMTGAHRLYTRLGFTRAPELDWSPAPHVQLLAFRLPLGTGAALSPPRPTLEA